MKRIHYIPGLISLALLFPLGLWYLHSQRAFKQERSFNLIFLPPEHPDEFDHYSEWRELHSAHASTPPDFVCNGSLDNSLGTLLLFRQRMADLARASDTTTWVHVRFTPDAKYATVMHAIETCRLNTDIWSHDGNDLITRFYRRSLHSQPQSESVHSDFFFVCGLDPVPFCGTNLIPPSRSTWGIIRSDILHPIAEAAIPVWPAIPLFLGLAVVGLVRAKRHGTLPMRKYPNEKAPYQQERGFS